MLVHIKFWLFLVIVLSFRQLKHQFPSAAVFSTDEYFFTEDGIYVFDPDLLEEAHKWNQKRGKQNPS